MLWRRLIAGTSYAEGSVRQMKALLKGLEEQRRQEASKQAKEKILRIGDAAKASKKSLAAKEGVRYKQKKVSVGPLKIGTTKIGKGKLAKDNTRKPAGTLPSPKSHDLAVKPSELAAKASSSRELALSSDTEPRKRRGVGRFLTEAVPPRSCNGCQLSAACPMFKPNFECAFTGHVEDVDIDGPVGARDATIRLLEAMHSRIRFGLIAENLSGTPMDESLSKAMQMASMMARDVHQMSADPATAARDGSGVDGSQVKQLVQVFLGVNTGSASNPAGFRRPVIDVHEVEVEGLDEEEVQKKLLRKKLLEEKGFKEEDVDRYLDFKSDEIQEVEEVTRKVAFGGSGVEREQKEAARMAREALMGAAIVRKENRDGS